MPDIDPNLPLETETAQPETEKPAEQPAAPAIDYETKFKESTRENQILQGKLKAREDAEQELTKEPTDSELKAAFPDWDSLSDFEKKIARDNLITKKLAASAVKTTQELQNERAWNTSIELALSSVSALQGKEQAFRQFASQPKYKGTLMELLIDAFLQKNPEAPKTVTPRPGLEPGSGGPKESPKPAGLTMEQLAALRSSDPRAYEQYIKTHDIEIDE